MPAPAARRPGTTSTRPRPSAGGSAPRLPSQPALAAPARQPRPARIGRIRTGLTAGAARARITQLRGIMRRTLRHPPAPARDQAHSAARTAPRPASRSGPARAPASLVSGRKGGGHMIAHHSAGPDASFVPPRPVLLLRYPPGPPSPRLGAGPGLGRRGAAGAGGWRPCSRGAHRDGEPLQAQPAEAGRPPAQRSGTTARAAGQDGRPGMACPPRPARPARRTPGR